MPGPMITLVRESRQYVLAGSSAVGWIPAVPETILVPTPRLAQLVAAAGLVSKGIAGAAIASATIKRRCMLREVQGGRTIAGLKVVPFLESGLYYDLLTCSA